MIKKKIEKPKSKRQASVLKVSNKLDKRYLTSEAKMILNDFENVIKKGCYDKTVVEF